MRESLLNLLPVLADQREVATLHSRFYHQGSVVALVLATILASVPAALADHSTEDDSVRVCMRIVNAAGWPLENIEVSAVRVALSASIGSTATGVTDAQGDVALVLAISDFRFSFRDNEAPTSPARNGLLYAPRVDDAVEVRVRNVEHESCADGSDGQAYEGGIVTLALAPQQGILQINITDGVEATRRPLADVSVVPTATLQADNTVGAVTDPQGEVRMACVVGAANPVLLNKTGFLLSTPSAPCAADAGNYLDIDLWRIPVIVDVQVTNTTTLARTATGSEIGDAVPVASPIPSANVTVTERPATLTSSWDVCRYAGAPAVATPARLDARQPALLGTTAPAYICSAPADDSGRASLLLPWTEETPDHAEYTFAITAPGYAMAERTHSIHAHDVELPETGINLIQVTLQRATVTLRGVVDDIQGALVPDAVITFSEDVEATTGADGSYETTVQTGPYSIEIAADGYQTRACQINVGIDAQGDGVIAIAPSPSYCFTLVTAGTVGIRGTVHDRTLNIPIPGLSICQQGANPAVCDPTSANGGFQLEVQPSGAAQTIAIGAGQDWTVFTATATATPGTTAGVIVTLPTTLLAKRAIVPLDLKIVTAADAPVAGASIVLSRGETKIDKGHPDNLSLATGSPTAAWFITDEPIWTTRSTGGPSPFDISDYVATARTQLGTADNSVHYKLASTVFPLFPAGNTQKKIVLDTEENTYSIAVIARDANAFNETTTRIRAALAAPGNPAISPGPQNVIETPGDLILYDHGVGAYNVCAESTDLYQASFGGGNFSCQVVTAGVTPPIYLNVLRTTATLTIRGIDAHTGWPLAGYVTAAVSDAEVTTCTGTVSEPAQTCARTTALQGAFTGAMTVPWSENTTDLCIRGAAGQYRAIWMRATTVNNDNIAQTGEQSTWQTGTYCNEGGWRPGQSYIVDVTPLRAPDPAPLQGTVSDVAGEPVADARLTATSERLGFVCNPEKHNSSTPFPACSEDGVGVVDGAYSLAIPSTGVNGTWKVDARASGMFTESFVAWPTTGGLRGLFRLYPTQFTASVRVTDSDGFTTHKCGTDPELRVFVILRALASGTPNRDDFRERAYAQPDGTCLATFFIDSWHRDPQPMPVAANQPWPWTSEPFLVLADQDGHAGAVVARLGPADADRIGAVTMIHPSTSGPTDQASAITDCASEDGEGEGTPSAEICGGLKTARETVGGTEVPDTSEAQAQVDAIVACTAADGPGAGTPSDEVCSALTTARGTLGDPTPPDTGDTQAQVDAIVACAPAGGDATGTPSSEVCGALRTANETLGSVVPAPGTFTISGRLFDGDGLEAQSLGLPGTVVATGTSEDCMETAVAQADVTGAYTLDLPCAGEYSLSARPLDQLLTHWQTATSSAAVTEEAPAASEDIGLPRTTGRLIVQFVGSCTAVTLTPLDHTGAPVTAQRSSSVIVDFASLLWGAYTLTPVAGAAAAPSGAFVAPGMTTNSVAACA